jgi:hypothetical protein
VASATDANDAAAPIDAPTDQRLPDGALCVSGEVETQACGNCGRQVRLCTGGAWGSWAACGGEGVCAIGALDTGACGSDVGTCQKGTRTRWCMSTCHRGARGACGGTYVGPVPDTCGDALDNNCTGVADEGCSCQAISKGGGGSFDVSSSVYGLTADPSRCLAYAIHDDITSQFVIFDTGLRKEVGRVDIPHAGGIAVSPNGQWLAVGTDSPNQILVVDRGVWTVTATAVAGPPGQLRVTNAGIAYYVMGENQIRRADLVNHTDVAVGTGAYNAALDVSPDGLFIYMGDYGASGANISKCNKSLAVLDVDIWDDGYGFGNMDRRVYLGGGGKNAYYARYALDANNLRFVRGKTDEVILVENKAGSVAVGSTKVFDAALVKPIASLPEETYGAVLLDNDAELWTHYSTFDGNNNWITRIRYSNIGDFIDGVPLGVRERAAQPLATYTFNKLVADPSRSRLYGLDAAREMVVAIDTTNMSTLGAIIVGSTPSDLAVDTAANYLYVGHTNTLGLAQIDLATWKFTKFLPTRLLPHHVAKLASGRLATIDDDQWTTLSLFDPVTGTDLDGTSSTFYVGGLSSTTSGWTLFAANSAGSAEIIRFDIVNGKLQSTARGIHVNTPSGVVATPDGTGVYYAGMFLDGADVYTVRYPQTDEIMAVTPNGLLATSSSKVYRVSDGALRGTLPVTGSVQAASPDSARLYVALGAGIQVVDLSVY